MRFENLMIDSLACVLPPEIRSSEEIEVELKSVYDRLGLNIGRLELMTGIRERRFWKRGFRPSDGAVAAAEKALATGDVSRQDIGCVAMCSVCRDCLEPATAAFVHHRLGLGDDAILFDLSNACLGVLTAMTTVGCMIEQGRIKAGLIVAAEDGRGLVENTIRKLLDDESITRQSIKPYFASLTIGSGAFAMVLTRGNLTSKQWAVRAESTMANTNGVELCQGGEDLGGLMMSTNSEELMREGVAVAHHNWIRFLKTSGWKTEMIDKFFTHQVGAAHRKLLFETLRLDKKKDCPTVEFLGNSGSTACPTAFALAMERGEFEAGEKVALLGIGSGIVSTMIGVEL